MSDYRITTICPVCEGCGRTSLHPFTGRECPQPLFVSGDTTARGWTTCSRCQGVGVVPLNHAEATR